MFRSVKSGQRQTRDIDVILTDASLASGTLGTGGVTEGTYKVTAMKGTTGIYTIQFNVPFTRAPRVLATASHATSNLVATITSRTVSQVVVHVATDAGTAAAATELHLNIRGWDSANQN